MQTNFDVYIAGLFDTCRITHNRCSENGRKHGFLDPNVVNEKTILTDKQSVLDYMSRSFIKLHDVKVVYIPYVVK